MSSVRFICGTQDIHKLREKDFWVLWYWRYYFICGFDANGGFLSLYLERGMLSFQIV
jgi:hypothetical protein